MAIIDLVNWSPQENETIYAYKFPETNLSTFTQLIVQESQEAILFSKGQIIGKFGPGKHTLNTENLPILRKLYGLPFGGKNPFMAEVWFVNKLQPFNIDWSIDRMDIHDADYNTGIPLVANGRYGLRIADAERFLIKIVGTRNKYTEYDLTDQFLGEFSTKTKSTLMQFMLNNRIGLKQISAHLDSISEHLRLTMQAFWENIGFELTRFYVTTIEVDSSTEVGKRVLDAISRQSAQAIGGYTWQQSQMFEVAKDAVDGIGGGGSNSLLGAILATNMMGNLGGGGTAMQPQYNQPTFGGQQGTQQDGQQGGQNISVKPPHEVFCSNCSKKFSSNLNFCPHCGDEYCPCSRCGTDNDKNAKRCVSCGQALRTQGASCPDCKAEVSPDSSFCENCGKMVADNKCTRCGFSLAANMKFCPKCGQKRE